MLGIGALRFELSESDVAERLDRRKVLLQDADTFFTLRSTIIVFTARMPVFDHGVANDHGNAFGKRKKFVIERPAIEKNRVAGVAETGSELVHDTDPCADEFVFSALAKFGNFHER